MKYLVLIALLSINIAAAKEYQFTHEQIVASPINNSGPQIFLFDQSQKLTFKSGRFNSALLSKFKLKAALPDSDTVKDNLEELLNEPLIFNSNGFTLFYVTIASDVGPCKPCRDQEALLKKIKSRFKDKLKIHTITIIQSYTYKD